MAKQRGSPDQDSDYDGAWKEALRTHLRELMSKYFPAIHAAINWDVEPQWFDKEVSQVLGQSGRRNRAVDVLVQVRLVPGAEQWILLHAEVQSAPEAGFERRVARYNGSLFGTFDRRVVTLVVLADLREEWRPCQDVFQVADFESRLRFPTCKLLDKLKGEWRDDFSLPVQVARSQIEALRSAGNPLGRYRAKWRLVRKLYELGYNAVELREIFRLIDWMMHLQEDLSQRFERKLTALEESLNMPYVTSVERSAEARGEARGEVKGGASVLLKQLGKLCGSLPEDIEQRIRNLPLSRLEELGEALLAFRSREDLKNWLNANEDPTE